jgi:predicted ferric reductase
VSDSYQLKQRRSRAFAVASPLVVTAGFWIAAKVELGWVGDPLQWVSQILSLLVLTTFALVLLIAARNRTIERIYGGLDKSYLLHGKLARIAWFGMILHPFLLIPSLVSKGYPFWSVLVPVGPWPAGFEAARAFGVAAYYGFIILVLLTLSRRVDYQIWLSGHRLMGLCFLFGFVHTLMANSDVRNYEPLRDWTVFVGLVGILSWLYKLLGYGSLAQRYRYEVESVREMGSEILELNLLPLGARMNYEPGEFAFISIQGSKEVPSEPHPFSISSTPTWYRLRFSIRQAGNYTKKLSALKPKDKVMVYGPYGEFTSYQLDEFKKQVWVGGGIGITPFLSMAHHESTYEDRKEVHLIYGVKAREQAVYDAEIAAAVSAAKQPIDYWLSVSDDEGFLTAEKIAARLSSPLTDYAFLFCGPPIMMRTLKKQLMEKGVSADQIFFEEFDFV